MPHTNRKKKNVKTSLRPIPLSLRGKKRYVAFELEPLQEHAKPLTREIVWRSLSIAALHVFGSAGLARQRLQLMSFNPVSRRGIVRCAHTQVSAFLTALLFVHAVGDVQVRPRSLLVSGSISKLKALVE